MPRVVNLVLAAVFLVFLVPIGTHLAGRSTGQQVALVLLGAPFVLLTAACLASAIRPGSLGRLARRTRRTRGT